MTGKDKLPTTAEEKTAKNPGMCLRNRSITPKSTESHKRNFKKRPSNSKNQSLYDSKQKNSISSVDLFGESFEKEAENVDDVKFIIHKVILKNLIGVFV